MQPNKKSAYKIGMAVDSLPEKNTFSGAVPLMEVRGWDKLMQSQPNRWVILDQTVAKTGGGFWSRANDYNKKYANDGYKFAVRKLEGVTTFFGRFSPTSE